ncbi:MAG: NAD(P)/FAD-dependent oxidoreductase, partial [Proteobacteria bacterium]|nr:NAD(P)/FAD-dependent oxidoreductase [Pseudomonadota bacterium]
GVLIERGCNIEAATRTEQGFLVRTGVGDFAAQALVLALGGPSWPQIGATDLGFKLAKNFGLKVVPPRPALVPLTLPGTELDLCRALSGVSLPARLTCGPASELGDLLFTHKGLSGPVVLQLSSRWTRGREVVVDLLPDQGVEGLLEAARGEKMQLKTLLGQHLPSRLPPALLGNALAETVVNQLGGGQVKEIAQRLHEWRVVPSGTEGYAKAEVTAGGVDTRGFSSKTMEANDVPGLYAIGEVLDVTGRLGGYNLQWAWSSAFAAAQHL